MCAQESGVLGLGFDGTFIGSQSIGSRTYIFATSRKFSIYGSAIESFVFKTSVFDIRLGLRNLVLARCWSLLQHTRRVASDDCKIRDILCHNTSRADNHALSNRNAWQDNNVAAKPAVRANLYGFAVLWALGAIPQIWIQWVGCAIKGTIGPDQCSVAHFD